MMQTLASSLPWRTPPSWGPSSRAGFWDSEDWGRRGQPWEQMCCGHARMPGGRRGGT